MDGLQIPPVRGKNEEWKEGSGDAIPFVPAQRQSRKIHHLVLSEIVRQGAGNPIIEYATEIRNQVKHQSISHDFVHTEDSGVEVIPRKISVLRELFSKYFDTEEFNQDPDYVKVVAWRNDTVDYFNREIRLLLHKAETLPRILVGEKLIMNKPIIKGEKVLIPNNEELVVKFFDIITVPVKYKIIDRGTNIMKSAASDGVEQEVGVKLFSQDFKVYRSLVENLEQKTFVIDILHEDDLKEFEDLRKKLETCAKKVPDMYDRKEMWKEFYKLDKHFADVNYNYCVTAHKALNKLGLVKPIKLTGISLELRTLTVTAMIAA